MRFRTRALTAQLDNPAPPDNPALPPAKAGLLASSRGLRYAAIVLE